MASDDKSRSTGSKTNTGSVPERAILPSNTSPTDEVAEMLAERIEACEKFRREFEARNPGLTIFLDP